MSEEAVIEQQQDEAKETPDQALRISGLEAAVAEKDLALSEAKKMLDAQAADITSLKTANDEAVKAYKKLAVGSNPLFTEDVITGATIAEIDGAMARVTDLAGKIKAKVEAEIKAVIVPAGAPERSGPDTSGLSPREKIKHGLQEEKK